MLVLHFVPLFDLIQFSQCYEVHFETVLTPGYLCKKVLFETSNTDSPLQKADTADCLFKTTSLIISCCRNSVHVVMFMG